MPPPVVRITALALASAIASCLVLAAKHSGQLTSATGACPTLVTWQMENSGIGPDWIVVPAGSSAHVADAGFRVFEASLASPEFLVPESGLELDWLQDIKLSWANTAGVLEVRMPGAGWVDFLAAGGRFIEGGYNADAFTANPLGMRRAWGGPHVALATRAVLPPRLSGSTVELRFRVGSSGTGDAQPGWTLRDLHCH